MSESKQNDTSNSERKNLETSHLDEEMTQSDLRSDGQLAETEDGASEKDEAELSEKSPTSEAVEPLDPSRHSVTPESAEPSVERSADDSNLEGGEAASTPPVQSNESGILKMKLWMLAHKKASIALICVCAVLVLLLVIAGLFANHVICFHEWEEATCNHPKTCSICGATEGDRLDHDLTPATCTEPQICKRCGVKVGDPAGHSIDEWTVDKEATCSQQGEKHGVCTTCGEVVKEAIPTTSHTEGEWVVEENYTVTSSGVVVPGTRALKCSVCGETIRTEDYTVELTMGQKNALAKAQSYLSVMPFSHSGLVDQLEFEGFSHEDSTFAADNCGADWNEQAALKAESYLSIMSFSRSGLIDQLEFEGFTREQAEYGVSAVGY